MAGSVQRASLPLGGEQLPRTHREQRGEQLSQESCTEIGLAEKNLSLSSWKAFGFF